MTENSPSYPDDSSHGARAEVIAQQNARSISSCRGAMVAAPMHLGIALPGEGERSRPRYRAGGEPWPCGPARRRGAPRAESGAGRPAADLTDCAKMVNVTRTGPAALDERLESALRGLDRDGFAVVPDALPDEQVAREVATGGRRPGRT